ncbi:Probably inactive leucine-rich repeat receptor-like protein kinase [Glycine soja]|uniref:Probably inactive leucine-rich repeat receptor-like protein kinase n=1 Tax=Glycine soja TaxID=3848 RepID=A0A0B2SPI0_GLYSO|nr:Probably inactive leucine-rich repeat receptor-like protein kinase [Glycine soja]
MNKLLRFKKGVRDPSGMLSSWLPKLDCCRWTGVKCDNITGRVTQLSLPCHTTQPEVVAYQEKDDKSHCLTGEFSLTLLELEFLSYLDFSNNDFKSIQYSPMGSHKCVHLPKEIDWLQSVTMLPSLLELTLENCQLENIYPFLHCDISHIDLSQNRINSQLPERFPNFRSIQTLFLSDNYLKGPIPNWLGQLEELKELDLSHNSFSGPIPEGLGNLSSLINLILESNELNGNLPDNLGHLFNLETLAVSKNSLTGIVSERNLRSLTNLKSFSMGSPSLVYDFDPEWVPPFQLVSISLGYVRDKLPAWLFTQSSLTDLKILDSTASFEPLDKFWNFATQLEYFVLVNSTINGDISNVLLSSKLVWLDSNNLRGGMPRISPEATFLTPWAPCLTFVLYIWKATSYLGSVPLEIYMLTGLQSLNLSHNQLMGTIPQEIGNLKQLEAIDLSRNQFSGEIPVSLSALHYLSVLNLSFNNLMGKIPSGTQLGSTDLSYIGNSDLCGPPLTKICPQDEKSHNITKPVREEDDDDDKSEVYSWFYMGMGIGFAVGFWGVFGTILFNRRCRHVYFRFLHRMYDFVIRKMTSIY